MTVRPACAGMSPTADALVINGDLVAQGTAKQYQDLYAVLGSHTHPATVLAALGNHEQYSGEAFDTQVKRFLSYTTMPDVYSERKVGRLPLLFIGTTAAAVNKTSPPFVTLGRTQLEWLEGRLKAYAREKYVLIFSHHVLPGTVSGTTGADKARFYNQDFVENDELLTLLGAYPNVVFFSGHTHWDLGRADWASTKIVSGGHPSGFRVFNTGAIQTSYGPDGSGGEKAISAASNQVLRVLLNDQGQLTVLARNFATKRDIKKVTF